MQKKKEPILVVWPKYDEKFLLQFEHGIEAVWELSISTCVAALAEVVVTELARVATAVGAGARYAVFAVVGARATASLAGAYQRGERGARGEGEGADVAGRTAAAAVATETAAEDE